MSNLKKLIGSDPNQVSLNRDLGSMAFQDSAGARIETAQIDTVLGKVYASTSTSGGTSIIDTGLTLNNYDSGAVWMVVWQGDANTGGSSTYRSNGFGILSLTGGWNGSAVTHYLNISTLHSAQQTGTLTLTPAFWNASTSSEVASSTGVPLQSSEWQIRLKISGYNASYPAAYEIVRLIRIL